MATKITYELDINTASIGQLEDKFSKLKSKLDVTPRGTQEWKNLQSQVVGLDSKLKNVRKSVEGVDMEAMAGEAGKFAGGIGAMTGAMILFGDEGDETMQELQENMNKGIGIMMAAKGATEVFTSSMKLLVPVQRALNTAMKNNPIGIVLVATAALAAGIGLLIIKMNEETKDVKSQTEEYKKLKEAIDEANDAKKDSLDLEDRIRIADKLNKRQLENLIKDIETELAAVEDKNTDLLAKQEAFYSKDVDLTIAHNASKNLENAKANKEISDATAEVFAAGIETSENLKEQVKENNKDLFEDLDKSVSTNNKTISELKTSLSSINKLYKTLTPTVDDNTDAYDKNSKSIEELLLEKRKLAQASQDEIDNNTALFNSLDAIAEASDAKEKQRKLDKVNYDKKLSIVQLDIATTLTGGLINLLSKDEEARKENAVIIKTLALGNIAIGLGQTLTNNAIVASSPNIQNAATGGLFGLTMLATMNALAYINAGIQAATIIGTKYEKGGILNGPSHANGGIMIGNNAEVEGGEAIINKRSTKMYAPILSTINAANGNGNAFAGGGDLINYEKLAGMLNDVEVYVVDHQMTKQQGRTAKVKNRSSY